MKKQNQEKSVKKSWLKMPSAFTIMFAIIAITAGLTWIIPSGSYQYAENDDGDLLPVAGTYEQVDKVQTVGEGEEAVEYNSKQDLWDVASAPVVGVVGQSEGDITPAIDGAMEVMIFVLIIGGFLGVVLKTGALEAFFGEILKKLKGKEHLVIPVLMAFFALGGTTFGMQEETVAFYALVVPMMLAIGYNGMTAALIIILGSGVGLIGSTVNPFSVGIASGFAGVSIGDGIVPRIVILLGAYLMATWFVMNYAKKYKAGEYQNDSKVTKADFNSGAEVPEFTAKHKSVMVVFGLTFLTMMLAVIPWAWKFDILFFENLLVFFQNVPVLGQMIGHAVPLGDWWFNEMSMLFLVASFVVYLVYYVNNPQLKNDKTDAVSDFVKGASDLLAVALIIGLARGVTVIMENGQIMDTVLVFGESVMSGVPSAFFGVVSFLVYLPMSFFVPSTSGLATATMPIMAPLADFAGVSKHILVTAYTASASFVNIVSPTIPSVIGGLVLAKVSYATYIKRTWKLLLAIAGFVMIVLLLSAL